MAASGDVTITQDGGPAKLHPYLVALVRWCVSCLWSTATVLLHRMMMKPLIPQITGVRSHSVKPKPRPAGREHLHPEPKVECVVLHQPEVHNLDVVFVHGLYGSLCNTWRQGEWRSRYQSSPQKIHLRRPAASPSPCTCHQCDKNTETNVKNSFNNEEESMVYYSENDNKYIYEENSRVKENIVNKFNSDFDNNTIMMSDYDSENAFKNIDEQFYNDIRKILPKEDEFITETFYNNGTFLDQVEIIENYETQAQFVSDLFKSCDNNCDHDDTTSFDNYDIKIDENKSEGNMNIKNYHENCKCIDKICEVGCGCICDDCYSPCWPRDWIKEDYPEARVISINYTSDPHLWRPLWIKESKRLCLHERAEQMTKQLLDLGVGQRPVMWVGHSKGGLFIKQIYCEAYEAYLKTHQELDQNNQERMNKNNNSIITEARVEGYEETINYEQKVDDNANRINEFREYKTTSENSLQIESTNLEEDILSRQASLWTNSGGFMFYSVPHRGSPLADIKTPITARSIELMEISKDNSLVLSLQERWLRATAAAATRPLVRSLVETRRTLMSVLWLRIVDTDSADPGIGALCGVPVDHREICKPSSRHCLLYKELVAVIKAALNRSKPVSS